MSIYATDHTCVGRATSKTLHHSAVDLFGAARTDPMKIWTQNKRRNMASQSVPEYGLRVWSEIWPQNRPQPAAHKTMPKHGPGPQIGAEAWGWAPNRAQNMASKSAPKCGPRFNTKIQHSKRIQNMALDSIPRKTPTCSAKIRIAWGRTRYPTICGRAHILLSNYDTAEPSMARVCVVQSLAPRVETSPTHA